MGMMIWDTIAVVVAKIPHISAPKGGALGIHFADSSLYEEQ